ncbi:MAG TPA: sigma-70 family RNA polymerase sigma factor [Thermoleophilaceae bacterium]
MTPRRLIEPARLAGSALLHTQSDERLVDLARSGNDRAFEAIVARYRRPLLRYCRKLLPPERAEDAVQQAFLNAYRAIGAGEAELNLKPWLYRIAHNASLSLLRQNGWSHEELDEQFDGVQQPPQAFEQREQVREVVRAVQGLPERQRDAVVLRELEGRSYDEIAVALGVSGGAVRQLLNRARTNLRAAATALTPFDLVAWCVSRGGAGATGAERIAELTAGGAGGLAAAAKLGTALVVAGAVAGAGTGVGPLPDMVGGGGDAGAEEAAAAEPAGGPAGEDGPATRVRHGRGADGRTEGRGRRGGDDRAGRDRSRSGSDDDSGSRGSGSGGGSDDDDGGSGSSGSGSGDDDSGSGSSGSGSGGSDSSGSGSSGSDSSGSGSSGSGTSGSGSSGSGTSGSGSDSSGSGPGPDSRSGSGDSGTSGSGSGTSGSGSGSGSNSGSGSGLSSGSGSE